MASLSFHVLTAWRCSTIGPRRAMNEFMRLSAIQDSRAVFEWSDRPTRVKTAL
jgi:hypothetical protein